MLQGRREKVMRPVAHTTTTGVHSGERAARWYKLQEVWIWFVQQRRCAGWSARCLQELAAAPGADFYRSVAALGLAFFEREG